MNSTLPNTLGGYGVGGGPNRVGAVGHHGLTVVAGLPGGTEEAGLHCLLKRGAAATPYRDKG